MWLVCTVDLWCRCLTAVPWRQPCRSFPLSSPWFGSTSCISNHWLSSSSLRQQHLDLFALLQHPPLIWPFQPYPPPLPPSSSPFGCLPRLSSLCLSNLLLLPSCTCHISRSSAVSRFAQVRQRLRSRRNGGIFNKSRLGIRACESDERVLSLGWWAHLQAGFKEDDQSVFVCVCLYFWEVKLCTRPWRLKRLLIFKKRKKKKWNTFTFNFFLTFLFFSLSL